NVRRKELQTAKRSGANASKIKTLEKNLEESNKQLARTISASVVKYATTAVMGFIAKILLDKTDEYEEDGEMTAGSVMSVIGKDMLSDAFSSVLFGQELFDGVYSVITGDTYYGTSNAFFDSVEDLFTSAQRISAQAAKLVSGTGSADALLRSLGDLGIHTAELCKVPAGNIKNILFGFASNTAKAVGYDAQYAVLKARYGLGSKSRFYDLLYDAFKNDQSEYKSLKRIMLRDGFELTKINSEMKKRKNKAKSKE
ncbi:MAG: hypothetical protein J6B51_06745, partial [Clostridia bacterium]|nr:hypothetical protein [Clostridia bacterium]